MVNSENEPLANEKAYIGTSYDDDSYDFSTYKKKSNEEGFIQFDMFKPTNNSSLILENSTEYLPVYFNGINDDNFEGLNWDLGTITLLKLDEIITFTIIPNQISSNKTIYKIDLRNFNEKSITHGSGSITGSNGSIGCAIPRGCTLHCHQRRPCNGKAWDHWVFLILLPALLHVF